MKNKERDKIDIIIAIILASVMAVTAFFVLGFYKAGITAPYGYSGGDDFIFLANVKSIGNNGWFWNNKYLGAPYGAEQYGYPLFFGMNVECLLTKLIYFFVHDAVVTVNIQFLLIFALCSVSAYLVLRELGICRSISVFSAVLFGFAPYIFGRNVGHFNLTACYFVPLSILLCVWVFEADDMYLVFNKSFFKSKKNVLTIIISLLIANNGTLYYPFFTCFFLCIAAVYRVAATKKIKAVVPALKIIIWIIVFLGLALLPVLVYLLKGGVVSVVRGLSGAEIYGLKIVQFFVPLNGHGIGFLENLISSYNTYMPLVNENITSYLGVGAIIGFLCSLVSLFLPNGVSASEKAEGQEDRKECSRIQLFSRMIVFAVLLATIGGFSSLIGALIFPVIRSYNRISIFVMFLSLYVLCVYLQKAKNLKWVCASGRKRLLIYGSCIVFGGFCILEQLPVSVGEGQQAARLQANKAAYDIEERFVLEIEGILQEGGMVYQLPYHRFPEEGPVNGMNDYQLFTGFLHSDTLKWSYGSIKGTKEDQWNASIAAYPTDQMIDALIQSEFRGIYIDTRAYQENELDVLMSEIEGILKEKPIQSENGYLLFYNLYPYIARQLIYIGKVY